MRPPRTTETVALALAVVVLLLGSSSALPSPAPSPPAPGSPPPAATPAGSPAGAEVRVAPAFVPATGVVTVGPVAPGTPLDVAVGLAPEDPAGLEAYLAAEYGGGTPLAGHFLSPATLASRYGASLASLAAAESYFSTEGLSVYASPDRLLLFVHGPAAELGRAFGTSFTDYRDASGRAFFSHSTPAVLPASVPWTGVLGLGNVTPLRPLSSLVGGETPVAGPAAGCSSPGSGLAPCEIWNAYNVTPLVGNGTDGAGYDIGVVDTYSGDEDQAQLSSDLAAFDSTFSLSAGNVRFDYPVPTSTVLNASGVNSAWSVEDSLDLEWARASAPGATIDMAFSPNAGAGLYQAIDWLVVHRPVNVLSLSWGEPDVGQFNSFSTPCSFACNASTDGSYAILSPVLAFAAAEGISIFVATGDCGAAAGTQGVSTEYPSSDPSVTGVGGTALSVTPNGTYLSETGWSGNSSGVVSPGCVNQGGSGGGYSPFPRPWWQTGLPASPATRGTPDVALDANTPAALVYHGTLSSVAGTSLATPIWAGITADMDQARGAALGFLDPSIYRVLHTARYATDFHDVTTGNNGYPAGVGWDPVTGVGSPNVGALVHDLGGAAPAGPGRPSTFLYVSTRSGPAPLLVTFTVNASGGSGLYPEEGVYFGDGNASFTSNGKATRFYPNPGVYAAQSFVVDSSGNLSAASPPVVVVVGGGVALNVSLTTSSRTPAVGANVSFTPAVQGGTSPFSFTYYFGDGTFANSSSSAPLVHPFLVRGAFCASVVAWDSAAPQDGGVSARIGIAVGGVPPPDCQNISGPLVLTPAASVGVRDAPAEFPALFHVSGGLEGTVVVQYVSTDPYVAACECTLFRNPGTYPVHAFANDSANQAAVAETNVTVAPSLSARFTASPLSGPAPLTVHFNASASGGHFASASNTSWAFGTGAQSLGAQVSTTYTHAGIYLAVGHLSDQGHGNASEAFLVDVLPVAPPPLVVTGSVAPAVDLLDGSTVHFAASTTDPNGSVVPAVTYWSLGNGSSAFGASANSSYFGPFPAVEGNSLNGSVQAVDRAGSTVTVPFSLPSFFAVEPGGFLPRSSALHLTVRAAPPNGTVPLSWNGSASGSGPGGVTLTWDFGDGAGATGAAASHTYALSGNFTTTVTAQDGYGDAAVAVHGVAAFEPLTFTGGPSPLGGNAPLAVSFSALASGGAGAPYAYAWTFGDGGNATGASLSHTYSTAGTYAVTLNVSDRAGRHVVHDWNVTVNSPPDLVFLGIILGSGAAVGAAVAVLASRRRPARPPSSSPPGVSP